MQPGRSRDGRRYSDHNGSLLDMVAIQSMPTLGPSNVPTGWYARGSNVDSNNDNAGTVEVRAYAICASP